MKKHKFLHVGIQIETKNTQIVGEKWKFFTKTIPDVRKYGVFLKQIINFQLVMILHSRDKVRILEFSVLLSSDLSLRDNLRLSTSGVGSEA